MIGLALLAPPPSEAAAERAGDSPSFHAGTPDAPQAGVAPSPSKRGVDGACFLGVAAAPEGSAAASSRTVVHQGSEPPALTRWRIAHGTSTASP